MHIYIYINIYIYISLHHGGQTPSLCLSLSPSLALSPSRAAEQVSEFRNVTNRKLVG